MGTKKLYDDHPYETEFEAKVLTITSSGEEKGWNVVLDQTLFFPEEGGQSPDRGVLAGRRVLDVRIRDGEIHHILGEPVTESTIESGEIPGDIPAPEGARDEDGRTGDFHGDDELLPGKTVYGRIDWPHRFSNMQQHSGEHLFSGLVHRRYGLENVGFHCSDREVTLDYDGMLTMEQLLKVEREANAAIVRNIPSEVFFLHGEEAKTADYRSKLELSGEVRVVRFAGVDACACCAPHVARTGEIGCLKVVGVQKWKSGVRVNILCGTRALELFDRDHALLTELSRYLTTSPEEVFGLVARLREEKTALLARIRQMETERLLEKVGRAETTDGSILFFEASQDQKAAQEAVNALVSRAGKYAGIFIGNDTDGYRYIIGSANADAREAAGLLKGAFNARGGGKPAMVQGSVAATETQLRKLF